MYLLMVLCLQMVLRESSGTVDMEVDETRNKEKIFIAYKGYALEGSVTAVYQVDSSIDCTFHCIGDPRCQSYNLKDADITGKLKCELNNATKSTTSNSSAYVIKAGSIYHEAQSMQQTSQSPQAKTCAVVQVFNFTTLGTSGRLGPASLGNHYQGQPHQYQVTLLNGIQKWTVPITGQYRIEAVGASGGYDKALSYRGFGARMIGTFTLDENQVLKILVSQEGGSNIVRASSGGGGGSFVAHGNTPLIVAGGGGGVETPGSRHSAYCDAGNTTSGRDGYGGNAWPGGTGGHGATTANTGNTGGGGGGFYSDGRSGTNFGGSNCTGGEGGKGFLNGGIGGRSYKNTVHGGFGGGGGAYGAGGGGGGGGGYSGGASGKGMSNSCGGGGGSFNAGTDQQNTCCVNDKGHGYVLIRLLACSP